MSVDYFQNQFVQAAEERLPYQDDLQDRYKIIDVTDLSSKVNFFTYLQKEYVIGNKLTY